MSHTRKAQVVYNVPITVVLEGTGCDWSLGTKGTLRYEPARFPYRTEDPWELLNRFLKLKTEAEALAFLNETGYFSLSSNSIPIQGQAEAEQGVQAGLLR